MVNKDNQKRIIKVLQMGKHFSYLPIYHAIHQNWFGQSEELRFEPVEGETDVAVCEKLLNSTDEDTLFAIADPITAIERKKHEGRELVVLAPIVTNSAFWLATKDTSKSINSVNEISTFSKMIAYRRETTSFRLAKSLADSFWGKETFNIQESQSPLDGSKKSIILINPSYELEAFDRQEYWENTVFLTPNIIGLHLKDFAILRMIGLSPTQGYFILIS
jgi:hypothetical protein